MTPLLALTTAANDVQVDLVTLDLSPLTLTECQRRRLRPAWTDDHSTALEYVQQSGGAS
jgi:hypothetical protein